MSGPNSTASSSPIWSAPASRAHAWAKNSCICRPIWLDYTFISPEIARDAHHARLHHLLASPAGRQDAGCAAIERITAAEERRRGGIRHQPQRAVAGRISARNYRDRRGRQYLWQDG